MKGDTVPSIEKLRMLSACADGPELFYFPFAEVNYGGQVVPASWRGQGDSRHERYKDRGPWPIECPGEEVASDIAGLIESELLRCRSVGEVSQTDFSVYTGYSCVTIEQHHEKFGYGPHEFTTTEKGLEELRDQGYDG